MFFLTLTYLELVYNRDSLSDLATFESTHVITNKCVLVTNETFAVLPWLALFYGFRNCLVHDEWWYCKTFIFFFFFFLFFHPSLISEPWYVLKQGKPQGKISLNIFSVLQPVIYWLSILSLYWSRCLQFSDNCNSISLLGSLSKNVKGCELHIESSLWNCTTEEDVKGLCCACQHRVLVGKDWISD